MIVYDKGGSTCRRCGKWIPVGSPHQCVLGWDSTVIGDEIDSQFAEISRQFDELKSLNAEIKKLLAEQKELIDALERERAKKRELDKILDELRKKKEIQNHE